MVQSLQIKPWVRADEIDTWTQLHTVGVCTFIMLHGEAQTFNWRMKKKGECILDWRRVFCNKLPLSFTLFKTHTRTHTHKHSLYLPLCACYFVCISAGSSSYLTPRFCSSLPSGRKTLETYTHKLQKEGFSQCGTVKWQGMKAAVARQRNRGQGRKSAASTLTAAQGWYSYCKWFMAHAGQGQAPRLPILFWLF